MKENNRFFALKKINLVMIAVSFIIIVLGFFLMAGVSSGETYNPEIFSVRHITIGPMISFAGFLLMIFAIMYKPKSDKQ